MQKAKILAVINHSAIMQRVDFICFEGLSLISIDSGVTFSALLID